jgi:hypothetical protein
MKYNNNVDSFPSNRILMLEGMQFFVVLKLLSHLNEAFFSWQELKLIFYCWMIAASKECKLIIVLNLICKGDKKNLCLMFCHKDISI